MRSDSTNAKATGGRRQQTPPDPSILMNVAPARDLDWDMTPPPTVATSPKSAAAMAETIDAAPEGDNPSAAPAATPGLLHDGAGPTPAPPAGPVGIDRFEIVRPLGAGGMGDVFLARHPVTGTDVAVKRLKPSLVNDRAAVQRFLTEARHMYHLNHPHILRIMEVWDPPAGPYYVMPYMPHGPLSERIRPGQPLDYVTTVRVARDVAAALAYAHGKGIIHRDLKPANVLLDKDGRAYLSDFGLVRAFDGASGGGGNDPSVDVTRSQCQGTAPYMSPAVAAGQAEDTRCDVYSFGAMLYELLTGHPPYSGSSTRAVLDQVRAGPPAPVLARNPHAPAALAAIAEGCMARQLRERYASMDDVAADLDRVAAGRPPLGPHGTEAPPAQPESATKPTVEGSERRREQVPSNPATRADSTPTSRVRTRKWAAAGGVLVLAALGTAAVVVWGRWAGQTETVGTAGGAVTAVAAGLPAPSSQPRTVDLLPLINVQRDTIRGS